MPVFVNGQRIDEKEIQAELERLRPHYERTFSEQTPEQQKKQLLEWSTENVIERTLLQQYADERSSAVEAREVDAAFEDFLKQHPDLQDADKKKIKLQLTIEKILDEVCKDLPEPSEQEVEKFYQSNKEQFTSPERIKVSHIVKHINWQADEQNARETIEKAFNEIKAGTPFELVVTKYSDCPERGGDLGYIKRGQMVEEFEDVVFNLNIGQISDVFRTRFGFHIAKLYDRKPSYLSPLDEVRDKIIHALTENQREKRIEAFIDELKSKAQIKHT